MKMKTSILAAAFALATSVSALASGKDIVDTAVEAGQFKTLAAALTAAGLVDTLKGAGPFTVFAPTDEAFAKLPAGTVENLLKPENKQQLTDILTYHVVAGKVMAADVAGLDEAKSVNGKMIDVEAAGGIGQGQRRHRHHSRRRGVERRHPCHRHGDPAAGRLRLTSNSGERP